MRPYSSWARRTPGDNSQTCAIRPAGGTFRHGRDGEHVEIDAIDFIRTLAGRRPGSGVLSNPLPL